MLRMRARRGVGGVYKEYAEMIGWDEFHPVGPVPTA